MASITGYVKFDVASAPTPCKTWYRLFGSLTPQTIPLIVLHGGPGVPHNYLLPLQHLATSHNIPVLFYDQLGSGNSTRLPSTKGDESFWTVQLFISELLNILSTLKIEHYDILGHSWGGMLGAEFAATRPKGLRKLVISCSPATMDGWLKVADRLRKNLPEETQETLTRCEANHDTEGQEYEDAVMVYYKRHLCRIWPFPEQLQKSFDGLKEDGTVSLTM